MENTYKDPKMGLEKELYYESLVKDNVIEYKGLSYWNKYALSKKTTLSENQTNSLLLIDRVLIKG